jgi:hypothetical protein
MYGSIPRRFYCVQPTISAGERPRTYALNRGATGIDITTVLKSFIQHSDFVIRVHRIYTEGSFVINTAIVILSHEFTPCGSGFLCVYLLAVL